MSRLSVDPLENNFDVASATFLTITCESNNMGKRTFGSGITSLPTTRIALSLGSGHWWMRLL